VSVGLVLFTGRTVRRLAVLVATTCAFVALVPAGSALAQKLEVTYVARQCTSFTNIFANRARNNIQESLRNLGPDSPYPVSGSSTSFLVNPDAEDHTPPQVAPNCTPIVGWRFTLGTGIVGRAVDGPWGSLSKVTGPFDTVIQTQPSVPLLNQNGDRLDDRTIAGAVTVELDDAQRTRAGSTSSLWVQGGSRMIRCWRGRSPCSTAHRGMRSGR
jgi:hypothetical protein